MLSGTYTGIVFQDFNANGARNLGAPIPNSSGVGTTSTAVDRGLSGVAVTAYNPAGNVAGTATTAADGTYTLNATGVGPYRVEFTNLPAGFFSGPRGPNSDTTVQFVPDGGATNVSLGLVRPEDYSQNNPPLATTLQYLGPANGPFADQPALISFPYTSGSDFNDPNLANFANPTTHALTVPFSRIGATWGLGYDGDSRTIYAASLMKRSSGFGPAGPGAIYAVNRDTGAVTTFAVLNAGADPHDPNDFIFDNGNTSWNAVGKRGLGGLDVGPDGIVYVMNLFDRSLYALRPDGTVAGVFPIPRNAPGATGTNGADLRPFAVQYYQGKVYVGVVNSAESTQNRADLHAYVYAFDPVAGTYSAAPVFQTDLDYPRGVVSSALPSDAAWNPWALTIATVIPPGGPSGIVYPQPELTGIAFDPDGNLVLGFRDRVSDQGFPTYPGGDVLRAFINAPGNLGAGWTLENNGRGPAGQGSSPQNTGEGPGGGEFYADNFMTIHDETALGAVLQLPGFSDVTGTFFDPVNGSFTDATQTGSGGLRWLNNATGQGEKAYRIYGDGTTLAGNFGKGGSIGDLIALFDQPPIEIGNRLWLDADHDGIQDAGEQPLAGVTVELRDADGNVIATAVTDANGNYTFSSDSRRTSTGAAIYGLDLEPATDYTLVVPPGQAALAGLIRTFADADASDGGDARDSDGQPNGSNGWTLPITTAGPGVNDHTADFGLFQPLFLGDQVWEDRNNNGVIDPGEPGLPGVSVQLLDAAGNVIATAVTDANGNYLFDDLISGDYRVRLTPPLGYRSSTGSNGSATGPYEGAPDPDGDINNDDSGTTVGPFIESGLITLNVGAEPTNDGDADPNSNLTVDFGLFQPASVSGQTFVDMNNNGVRDPGEPPIPGTTVILTGVDDLGNPVELTAVTGPDGSYRFDDLRPGTYTVTEVQPNGFLDGRDRTGSAGGATGDDVTRQIVLGPGVAATAYDFGELPASTCLEGTVYYDLNHNGQRDDEFDFGIAGVTVTLTGVDDRGQPVLLATTTDAEGKYRFEGLRPGTYTLTETQPRHFHDYHDAVGSLGGLAGNDRISEIVVQPGQCGMGYDFGELQPHGPQGRLRNVTVHTGNFVDLLNRRRALNPARFDAHHPAIGPVIAQGRVPWGIGMFPPSPKVYRQVPTVGTRPVPLGRDAHPRGPLASKSALARSAPRLGAARALVLNRGVGSHAGPHGRGH